MVENLFHTLVLALHIIHYRIEYACVSKFFSMQMIVMYYVSNFCTAPTQFMLYSRRNLAIRLLPDTSDCPEAVLPVQGLKTVKAIDYDPATNYLYWVNFSFNQIAKSIFIF